MRNTVYNSLIPNVASRAVVPAYACKTYGIRPIILILLLTCVAFAADWSAPEQQLARKIVAVTGPGAVFLTIENRSSLSRRDTDIVSGGLRAALESSGIRFVGPDQGASSITITLSENATSYVWVAQVRQGAVESEIVMVSAPRGEVPLTSHDSLPLSIRKTPVWAQEDRILDVVVLEESSIPTHIAVLDAENISLYHWQAARWQLEQSLEIKHSRPWPRDLRGRLIPAKDHLLDAYLPGVLCRTSANAPLTLNCRESDDPWPLTMGAISSAPGIQLSAFYAANRDYFTGALAPGIGKLTDVPKFYSAAFLPRQKYVLWLFAGVDGSIRMADGMTNLTAKLGWNDLTTLKTSCGAGWQVLATISAEQNSDSVRAFEFPDRDAVPVSAAVDFNGEITALWTEAKGDSAIAIAKNHASGNYEAFRLAMDCSQ